MQAVFYTDFGGDISIENVADPVPTPTGAVIRVEASGLCLSDWHGWMGHDPDVTLPHVPGHELAGVIEVIGTGVRRFNTGDRVTLPFVCGCGTCPQCASGNHQICDRQFQPGFTHWGSFAEYVAIEYADTNLVRLPDELDFVTAAALGCRFATAFRAVVDQGEVGQGQWVAVHGCGGVGLSAVMIATALGARVLAIDISTERLQTAAALGAEVTLDASENSDIAGAIQDLAGGAHVSIDALGHQQVLYQSVACLRKRGRHVQVGLLDPECRDAAIPTHLVVANELAILGSHGMQAHRYEDMLAMITGGRLQPDRLVGETIGLRQAPERLAGMHRFAGSGITVIDRFA